MVKGSDACIVSKCSRQQVQQMLKGIVIEVSALLIGRIRKVSVIVMCEDCPLYDQMSMKNIPRYRKLC